MVDWLMQLGGTLGVVVLTVVVIIAGRLILSRTVSDQRAVPFRQQLLTIFVALLGLFTAIAFLPVPTDVRAQILSVMGIVLSAIIAMSSTTLVGNAMAGIMVRLVRDLRPGDFVRVNDIVGRVADMGLFHCEIQRLTRDITVVPNSVLIQNPIHITRRAGTFVNAPVSIGYDAHHYDVESLLLKAAEKVELAEPFVSVEELLDYSVQYRVYGLLEDTSSLLSKTSALKKAILEVLHEHDVEIASPALVDRRNMEPGHAYRPAHKAVIQDAGSSESAEELAFDRAKEAESIDRLYAMKDKLKQQIGELGTGGRSDSGPAETSGSPA